MTPQTPVSGPQSAERVQGVSEQGQPSRDALRGARLAQVMNERDDLAARLAEAEAKVARVEALVDRLPDVTEGSARIATAKWPECDRDAYSLAIEEAQSVIRRALDGTR